MEYTAGGLTMWVKTLAYAGSTRVQGMHAAGVGNERVRIPRRWFMSTHHAVRVCTTWREPSYPGSRAHVGP